MSERIKRLQIALSEWKVEGCIVENSLDLYYLTGLQMSAGVLFLTPRSCKLFVDGRYREVAEKGTSFPVAPIEELSKGAKKRKLIAFDSALTSYARYQELKAQGWCLKGVPGLLQRMRAVKDAGEIALIKKSCRLALEGIAHIEGLLKPGVTEEEIARAFQIYCLKHGAEKPAFDPIIAFGANSAYPHHRTGKTRLKASDVVLIDAGVVREKYCSDFTRMFFPSKGALELKKMYEVVKSAQQAALDVCQPGTPLVELDEAAKKVVAEAGMEHLLAHGLGHGLGLYVHEFPRISAKAKEKELALEEGMVITIEPGLYLPGKGGVRYEDTVIITRKSYAVAL